MDTLVSSEWPLLNQDFDEGSLLADFDCDDFPILTNPACSPISEYGHHEEPLKIAFQEAFVKLKTLQKDRNSDGNTLTLGAGVLMTDPDDYQFVDLDFSTSDYEDDGNDPDNDCPCCNKKFKYRYQVVNHLERVHNRCAKCEYKFETGEELRIHQDMQCGKKSYIDDDNLSISGDEDTTSTLNDSLVLEEQHTNSNFVQPENDRYNTDMEDNKDNVWEQIRAMEAKLQGKYMNDDKNKELTSPRSKSKLSPPINIKKEPDLYAHDPSFEFEGNQKNPATVIKPNSLLKKRLRPNLSSKLRGRLKGHKNQNAPPPPALPPNNQPKQSKSPAEERPSVEKQPEERVKSPETKITETPVVGLKEEVMDDELEGELTCAVCELTFEGVIEIEEHTATHFMDKEEEVNCVVCDEKLPNIASLNHHETDKHSTVAYKCGDCGKIFNSQSSFKEHEKYHTGYQQCPVCDKKFLNDQRLKRHRVYRCCTTNCKCTHCKLVFDTAAELTVHKETHHGSTIHKCEKCSKCFDHKQTLNVHKLSHSGEDKPFKCKVCGKGFKTYWYYVVHEKCYCKHIDKTVHVHPTQSSIESSKKKFYQCKICCRVFPHISHLKVHNYIHTGERPYKCNSCGKGFTQKQNLKVHERVHTGEKPYICNSCGFGFKDLGNLRRHQYIHTGEKPHGCDVCQKRFTWVESLRRHKRTHLKQRPYQCKVCKREFVHYGHLKIHELVHKQDEKPFQCNICGKSFTMLSSLSIHEHIHLDRKPYPCDMCQRTFMTASALTTHKQSHAQRMANAYRQIIY